MKNIYIQIVPHNKQRYETVGDWYDDEFGEQTISVSDMKNDDYEFLVALHELVEQHLCNKRGVSEKAITNFDIKFEKNRKKGNTDESGDDPKAPYHNEHCIATGIERTIAGILGVSWKKYDEKVNSL